MLKDAVLVKSKPFVLNSSGKFPPTTSLTLLIGFTLCRVIVLVYKNRLFEKVF